MSCTDLEEFDPYSNCGWDSFYPLSESSSSRAPPTAKNDEAEMPNPDLKQVNSPSAFMNVGSISGLHWFESEIYSSLAFIQPSPKLDHFVFLPARFPVDVDGFDVSKFLQKVYEKRPQNFHPVYPSLFWIVDEHNPFEYAAVEEYLSMQNCLSFSVIEAQVHNDGTFAAVGFVLATEQVNVIIDLWRLGKEHLRNWISFTYNILQTESILKITNGFEQQRPRFVQIDFENIYDVSSVEKSFEGNVRFKSKSVYSFRSFRDHYRKASNLFLKFADGQFESGRLQNIPEQGFRKLRMDEIAFVLREVSCLRHIRSVQIRCLMGPCIREIELNAAGCRKEKGRIPFYDRDVSSDDPWAKPPPKVYYQPLTKTAGETLVSLEDDEIKLSSKIDISSHLSHDSDEELSDVDFDSDEESESDLESEIIQYHPTVKVLA